MLTKFDSSTSELYEKQLFFPVIHIDVNENWGCLVDYVHINNQCKRSEFEFEKNTKTKSISTWTFCIKQDKKQNNFYLFEKSYEMHITL